MSKKLTFHEMSTLIFGSIHVYSLEIRALQGNFTLIFSSIHVYSLEIRALQGNFTLIFSSIHVYSLEIRALQGNFTLIFSSIHVYSLEIRALQGNFTLSLQTCCRILRRKNCKLCFFCRYHVEQTCVPRTICLYFVESLSKSRKSRYHVVFRL